ncbi:siderophore ABC transporter permease [Alkalihalobacillus alcalophilus ATCC 27647 = CGMCC 1.3604]|uniref:Cobalamin/Fe3+-siderophores transporter n=1 Tax=Alkalihalobacillus alcalophilus ATCC 27647 = CGMCC 1.3604 TaxID=1218173 RepID=J8QE44_ALKAL|nr:iron ABC transporter permease [Alkalihalobacillus alcalophilus]AFV25635.1 cobalamin/Fe3+-siderophores transporter [Alkalihalobacillus alcalophilus ATCC 27647 = CGMCC 1.3604]KGA96021.1 siderophore ABC transporter permease [Alkalihalobacillus alcalophilus ATCC 27647 = CGMCC 1.3604]MED1561284.1 iron ABC transporter permease [Alkalihalobacillus alcalophilus]THG91869.1 siderophore ABC transporter permease [Alkalihalobacillus alcalophilus ATCC 27647 = CGMCC 1.3604]
MGNILYRKSYKIIGLVVCFLLLCTAFILSVSLGQTNISFRTTLEAFTQYDPNSTEHIIVTTSRLTRALIATVIGSSLAIAGALMQALTRNPLASPDLLGINAGGLFFIVLAITVFSVNSLTSYMWIAFLGAGIAGVLVFFLGSVGRDGLSPIKIILAGAAITALFASFTQGLLVIDEQSIQSILFWMAGSVSGRSLEMLFPVLPYVFGATLCAFFLGRSINVLLTGEDVAKGLGQRTMFLKIAMGVLVIILAGSSVAVAGAIGFVGLVVPHIVKGLVGPDYRWVIPYSALVGASLLLFADVVARFIIMPQEVPIGVMTAFIGAPFFVYIARKGLTKDD